MRFNTRFFLKDREGEEKVVQKYALLPISFGDDKEWVWLELVNIVYRVKKIDVGGSDGWGNYAWKWVPIRFATDQDMRELSFEFHNFDIYDLIEKKLNEPNFWLILDTIALGITFFDIKSAITLLIVIKLLQAIYYFSRRLFGVTNEM